ncbi:MAG: hypothetical protein GXC70_00310, partial [Sphingomonadaceae bacterium]|nr:hypothetical protein [Sphingomonadaceae bacterium]
MDDPLNRRMTVALLALMPLLALLWVSLRFDPLSASPAAAGEDPAMLAELQALPGRPGDLPPLEFAEPVSPGTDARSLNA